MNISEKTYKAIAFSVLIMCAYAIYCTGSAFINGVFPDGVLFAAIIGAIAGAFGYSTGAIMAAKKASQQAQKGPETRSQEEE